MVRLSVFGVAVGVAGLAMVLGNATMTGFVTGAAETAFSAFEVFGLVFVLAGLALVAASYHYKI
jgi:hypothetical protein